MANLGTMWIKAKDSKLTPTDIKRFILIFSSRYSPGLSEFTLKAGMST
jgi:hypothetical protein